MTIPFERLTRPQLRELLLTEGACPSQASAQRTADRIFLQGYRKPEAPLESAEGISRTARDWVTQRLTRTRLKVLADEQSRDGTRKFLFGVGHDQSIESVIIPRALKIRSPKSERRTACLSSQIGCAMACAFCLTGEQGLKRNLRVEELIAQVAALRAHAPIRNLVFMGMGEPLQNYRNLSATLEILLDPFGWAFSARDITVSTSGIVPVIERLIRDVEKHPVRLALSLTTVDPELRSELMPVNRRWGIEELLDSGERYAGASKKPVMLEIPLLRGWNDGVEHARALLERVRGRPFQINLIPFNAYSGSRFQAPALLTVKRLQNVFVSQGVTATVRSSGGPDILAACGQLMRTAQDSAL